MRESEKLLSLKLSDLRLIADLARHRSIRAVSRLREAEASQISRAVSRIEKATGEKLFRRSQGGVLPLEAALRMAKFYDSQIESLFAGRPEGAREVVIGAPSFISNYLVAPALGRVMRIFSDVEFKLIEMAPESLAREAIRGSLDVVIHMEKIDWPRTWETDAVGEMQYHLYGGKRFYPRAKLKSDDVKELDFIYPVYSLGDELVFGRDYCPLPVSRRRRRLGTATADSALHALADSDCVAFIPNVVAQNQLRSGDIRKLSVLDWPEVSRSVMLSFHADKVTQRFISELSSDLAKILKRA